MFCIQPGDGWRVRVGGKSQNFCDSILLLYESFTVLL